MEAPIGTKDEFSVSTPELAECAKMNFENVERMNPGLLRHPIYMLAKKQLDAVVARLSDETPDEIVPKSQKL